MKLNLSNIATKVNEGVSSSWAHLTQNIDIAKQTKKGILLTGVILIMAQGIVTPASAASAHNKSIQSVEKAITHKNVGGIDITNVKIKMALSDADIVKKVGDLAFKTNKVVLIDHTTNTVSLADAENNKILEGAFDSILGAIGKKVDLKAGSFVECDKLGNHFNSTDPVKTISDLAKHNSGDISAKTFQDKAKALGSIVILDGDSITIVDKNILEMDKSHYKIGGGVDFKPGSVVKISDGNIMTAMDNTSLQHAIENDGAQMHKDTLNMNETALKTFGLDLAKKLSTNASSEKTVHIQTNTHQVI